MMERFADELQREIGPIIAGGMDSYVGHVGADAVIEEVVQTVMEMIALPAFAAEIIAATDTPQAPQASDAPKLG